MSPVPANNNRDPDKQQGQEVSGGDAPQFVVANSESDSDGDDDGYSGYQLLPQDPDGAVDDDAENPGSVNQVIMDTLDDQDMMEAVSAQNQEEPVEAGISDRTELWNTPSTPRTLPMDQDKVDKIRAAMSGFSLPATAQPAWADNIPETEWKQLVMRNIHIGSPLQGGLDLTANPKSET